MKLQSAQEDITDLQTEFELERQDYLDTIRNQVLHTHIHTYTHSMLYALMCPGTCSEAPRAAVVYGDWSCSTRL